MYACWMTVLEKLHDTNSLNIFQRQTILESIKRLLDDSITIIINIINISVLCWCYVDILAPNNVLKESLCSLFFIIPKFFRIA